MTRPAFVLSALLCVALALAAAAGPREDIRLLSGARGQLMTVVEAALAAGADIEARDAVGRTALMWAAFHDQTGMTDFLIAQGADVNAQDGRGRTALIWAAISGRAKAARTLLAHAADPERADAEGRTARDWAVAEGHAGLARLLARH
jgi:ankyrin repeat protein